MRTGEVDYARLVRYFAVVPSDHPIVLLRKHGVFIADHSNREVHPRLFMHLLCVRRREHERLEDVERRLRRSACDEEARIEVPLVPPQ